MPPKLPTRFLIFWLEVEIFISKLYNELRGEWVTQEGLAFFPAQKMPSYLMIIMFLYPKAVVKESLIILLLILF